MSSVDAPFVEARDIHVSYDRNPILERVSMSAEKGAFVTIVGASGCGKSTFLRLLVGQESPQKGTILVDGKPITPEPDPDRGVVFQKYSVFPHLTVWQNLLLPSEFSGAPFIARLFGADRRRAEAEAEAMLDEIGLKHARDRYPSQLSGGMQQRLAIGQALIKRPRVLLLDEPFGALDPGIRADMHVLITELWQSCGMTVFMVTHDIQEAFKLGTRMLVFDKVRHDPHAPERYGATITYDLPLDAETKAQGELPDHLFRPKSHQGVKVHA